MPLSSDEFAAVESALTGPNGKALMALMERLTTAGRPDGDFTPEVLQQARELGWIDKRNYATELGWKMGDPIRELLFWNKRGRTVHDWLKLPVMHPEYFEGKRLLSIGCGCGTNLFSFQTMCSSVVGVEIEPTYLQFTPLWARMSDVEVPVTVESGAEHMPFEADEFDVVVCFGALQYMEILEVLREVSRVAKKDAIVVFTLSNLAGHVSKLAQRLHTLRRPQEWVREAMMLANMVVYPWTGRVIARKHDPVYPTYSRMQRWLADVDFDLDKNLTRPFDHEICYVARRR